MVSITTAFLSGLTIDEDRLKFKICPGTIIDLDDSSLPLGFLPIKVPRLTLQCGDYGRRGSDPNGADGCVIRGGGRRNPNSPDWNTNPQSAYKNSVSGIFGGGGVAQIYVHGESAYEITLKGLTFDNSPSKEELAMYSKYAAQFGKETLQDDVVDYNAKIEEDYDASVPTEGSSSVNNNNLGGSNKFTDNRDNTRNLQDAPKPAHRFASVAV